MIQTILNVILILVLAFVVISQHYRHRRLERWCTELSLLLANTRGFIEKEFTVERGLRRSQQRLIQQHLDALEAGQSYLAAELQAEIMFTQEQARRFSYVEQESPSITHLINNAKEKTRRAMVVEQHQMQRNAAAFWGRRINKTLADLGRKPTPATALPPEEPTAQLEAPLMDPSTGHGTIDRPETIDAAPVTS